MPVKASPMDTTDDCYEQSKHLRLSSTSKRLRNLRAFERIYYKKTWEVKKSGHGLVDEHQLNDGNLRCTVRGLTYSLNKKKRWLLPEVIAERIQAYDRTENSSPAQKGDRISSMDERLKIEMYENEDIHRKSTCLRYGNNQTSPQFISKNGRRFNSTTLSRWINFETREPRQRHRRNWDASNQTVDQPNQPNFGIEHRPGFFQSEVKYEFLYPRPDNARGKSTLFYTGDLKDSNYSHGRHYKDTTKNRRRSRQSECFDYFNEDDSFDDEEQWSIVIEESGAFIRDPSIIQYCDRHQLLDDLDTCPLNEFPIDHFIPLKMEDRPVAITDDPIYDRKAQKFVEEIRQPKLKKTTKKEDIVEDLLGSLPCTDLTEFISVMQSNKEQITQANLSPPIFVQRTNTSPFVLVYSYHPTKSMTDVTLKFTGLPPNIVLPSKGLSFQSLIDLVAEKLDEYQEETRPMSKPVTQVDVDVLRGSLPLPLTITNNMLLVQPKAADKRTALRLEQLDTSHENVSPSFSLDTFHQSDQNEFECSICCEMLTSKEVYQLLPCHHSLCHSCLVSFIRMNIANASPIKCFQNDCATVLNSALIQAFVSFDIHRSHHQAMTDRELFRSGRYRKCPSRSCSNLLIIDDPNKPSLMCLCGQRACSQCLEEYHFPATCEQYKSYLERLRESGDDQLSMSAATNDSHCYIAEGKNCPLCGEFVEKNGGCPHMTCKCGHEYCWMCLRRWATHDFNTCTAIPETTHELRSSTRNRLHNKAINHRRERNFYAYLSLSGVLRRSKTLRLHHDLLIATYIDMNTLAEFLYVLLQRRKIDINIRSVLARTARQLEYDASHLKIAVQNELVDIEHVKMIRVKLAKSVANLIYMKKQKLLI